MESQNGMRQPQLIMASCGSGGNRDEDQGGQDHAGGVPGHHEAGEEAAPAFGRCSRVSVEAPADSAPAEKPWASRPATSRIGAQTPTCS